MTARRKGSLHLGHGPKFNERGVEFRSGSGIIISYKIRKEPRKHAIEKPMPPEEAAPPPVKGVFWIEESDYTALRSIFDDGDKMPPTWNAWHKMAEEMKRGLEGYGHVVLRVRIDPRTFSDWCAVRGIKSSREGRKQFVAAAVKDRYGDQN
jgi:hypothetical protein